MPSANRIPRPVNSLFDAGVVTHDVSASVLSVLAPARSVISSVYGTYDMTHVFVYRGRRARALRAFYELSERKLGEAISV